mmetsp:Transcript_42377/g.116885  ORF Transcript_42377/g.116885 Transcript_42377/m.116885 type:complete len:202 (-) Transcript_42377:164-769(-)
MTMKPHRGGELVTQAPSSRRTSRRISNASRTAARRFGVQSRAVWSLPTARATAAALAWAATRAPLRATEAVQGLATVGLAHWAPRRCGPLQAPARSLSGPRCSSSVASRMASRQQRPAEQFRRGGHRDRLAAAPRAVVHTRVRDRHRRRGANWRPRRRVRHDGRPHLQRIGTSRYCRACRPRVPLQAAASAWVHRVALAGR